MKGNPSPRTTYNWSKLCLSLSLSPGRLCEVYTTVRQLASINRSGKQYQNHMCMRCCLPACLVVTCKQLNQVVQLKCTQLGQPINGGPAETAGARGPARTHASDVGYASPTSQIFDIGKPPKPLKHISNLTRSFWGGIHLFESKTYCLVYYVDVTTCLEYIHMCKPSYTYMHTHIILILPMLASES